MATLAKDANSWRIWLPATGGGRLGLRIGSRSKVTQRAAETITRHIQHLENKRDFGESLPRETIEWERALSDTLHRKLADAGLVEPRYLQSVGMFIDDYIASRTDVTEQTRVNLRQTRRRLDKYGDASIPMRDFTTDHADELVKNIRASKLAKATQTKTIKNLKQFFAHAVKLGHIDRNPFADHGGTVGGNKAKQFFVPRELIDDVIAKCPDVQWRLLIAMARYAGMRMPSEIRYLKWSDIHWEEGKFHLYSPKLERHGKEERFVPIFPELRPYLLEAFEAAEPGEAYVFREDLRTSKNIRTQFNRLVKRAGHATFAKPFVNMRSTRETELLEAYPAHVACYWIGNSTRVAVEHYAQITDEHFKRASSEVVQKAVQNAVQSCTERPGSERNASEQASVQVSIVSDDATKLADLFLSLPDDLVSLGGFEPPTLRL